MRRTTTAWIQSGSSSVNYWLNLSSPDPLLLCLYAKFSSWSSKIIGSRGLCGEGHVPEAGLLPLQREERDHGEAALPADGGGEGAHAGRGGQDCQAEGQQLQEALKEGEAAGPPSADRNGSKVEQETKRELHGLSAHVGMLLFFFFLGCHLHEHSLVFVSGKDAGVYY